MGKRVVENGMRKRRRRRRRKKKIVSSVEEGVEEICEGLIAVADAWSGIERK